MKTGPIERVTVGLLITCLANIPPARWLAERSAGARIALRTNSI